MLRDRGWAERGSVAITVALCMTVLLGFAALVVDIGLNWATRTSAQTAADSAALAGASVLLVDGSGWPAGRPTASSRTARSTAGPSPTTRRRPRSPAWTGRTRCR